MTFTFEYQPESRNASAGLYDLHWYRHNFLYYEMAVCDNFNNASFFLYKSGPNASRFILEYNGLIKILKSVSSIMIISSRPIRLLLFMFVLLFGIGNRHTQPISEMTVCLNV